ncbi:unnamed protein product [Rhizophagus irregularis]|nr:unnamed protein product [Rhizophagus irregularis]
MPVFTGLCEVMGNAIERKINNKSKRNLKYSEEFTNFLTILGGISSRALELFRQNLEGHSLQSIRQLRRNNEDYLTNPELCYENVARFKRLVDSINYNGPVSAMTDNTKLKSRLRYSPNLGCIIGSVFSKKEAEINTYNDIPRIINKIKLENGMAKNVRAYILQIPLPAFPPVVIALIPNKGTETANAISQLHKQLVLGIAPQLGLCILSLGSDGAITEFQAQQLILNIQTNEKLIIKEPQFNINFSCPIFNNVGPVVRIQDPKHAKKTARNAIMSGARLLTFGNSSARFDHFLQLINQYDSIMYKNDVINLDRQDDAAAYRTFCSSNFRQCLTADYKVKIGMEGFAIYIFVIGEIIDSYLNRNIAPLERIRMVITGYFFIQLWRIHIETLSQKYPEFISIRQNFLANQTFAIFISLCESLILLIKAHREYYPQVPFLPWFHGSEPVEHFFGIARQLNPDFDFADLIQILPKISQYSRALRSKKLSFNQEKTVRQGYHFDYNTGNLEESTLEILRLWPTDEQISQTIKHSRYLACELAEFLGMIQPADIALEPNLQVLINIHEKEVSMSCRKLHDENDKEQVKNAEIDLTTALTEASHEMKCISTEECDNNDDDLSNLFQKESSQLNIIDQIQKDLSVLYNGDSINSGFQYEIEDNLNFEILLQQRQRHEAYTSKPLERKFKTVSTKTSAIATIQLNKASHFVAYFTKNENPEQRFVTQREKRWKETRKKMSITLAQFHAEELAKLKKKQTLPKKKIQQSLIQIPNIETANISKDFPLIKGDYVFVIYGNQIDLTSEGCNILAHHLASNIIYHIGPTSVLVEENVLKLLGNEKQYYYSYFGRKDVIETIR